MIVFLTRMKVVFSTVVNEYVKTLFHRKKPNYSYVLQCIYTERPLIGMS